MSNVGVVCKIGVAVNLILERVGVVLIDHKMAESKEEVNIHPSLQRPAPGSRHESPIPSDRLSAVEDEEERRKRAASPRLSRKTLEELQSADQKRQEKGWEADDPPLTTPWTFWFQR